MSILSTKSESQTVNLIARLEEVPRNHCPIAARV